MKKEYIRKKIENHLEVEYLLLGRTKTEFIIQKKIDGDETKIFNSESSGDIDISTIVSIIAAVISGIDIVLKIVELKKKKNEMIDKKEIIIHLISNSDLSNNEKELIQEERVLKLLEEVIVENQIENTN